MKRLLLMIPMLLMFGCVSSTIAPPSTGKISALGQSIQKTAKDHQKTAASAEDSTAFQEIYDQSVMLLAANVEMEKALTDWQTKLKSAQDTSELRKSLVWLAPAFLIACCALFAAWGYFKFRWLEYAAVAAGAISIGSIVLYLAIQTIQNLLVWLVPAIVGLGLAYAVYWFISNRKKTTSELVASAATALSVVPAEAKTVIQNEISSIQSPQTKALVAQVQTSLSGAV